MYVVPFQNVTLIDVRAVDDVLVRDDVAVRVVDEAGALRPLRLSSNG